MYFDFSKNRSTIMNCLILVFIAAQIVPNSESIANSLVRRLLRARPDGHDVPLAKIAQSNLRTAPRSSHQLANPVSAGETAAFGLDEQEIRAIRVKRDHEDVGNEDEEEDADNENAGKDTGDDGDYLDAYNKCPEHNAHNQTHKKRCKLVKFEVQYPHVKTKCRCRIYAIGTRPPVAIEPTMPQRTTTASNWLPKFSSLPTIPTIKGHDHDTEQDSSRRTTASVNVAGNRTTVTGGPVAVNSASQRTATPIIAAGNKSTNTLKYVSTKPTVTPVRLTSTSTLPPAQDGRKHDDGDYLDDYNRCSEHNAHNQTHKKRCRLVELEVLHNYVKTKCRCRIYAIGTRPPVAIEPTMPQRTTTASNWLPKFSSLPTIPTIKGHDHDAEQDSSRRTTASVNVAGNRTTVTVHGTSQDTTTTPKHMSIPVRVTTTTTPPPARPMKFWKILLIVICVILAIIAVVLIRQYCCLGRFRGGLIRESWRGKAISAWKPNVFIERADIRCRTGESGEQVGQGQQVEAVQEPPLSSPVDKLPPPYPSIYPKLEQLLPPQRTDAGTSFASIDFASSASPSCVDIASGNTAVGDSLPHATVISRKKSNLSTVAPMWTANTCNIEMVENRDEDVVGTPIVPHAPLENYTLPEAKESRARTARFARSLAERQSDTRIVQVRPANSANLFPLQAASLHRGAQFTIGPIATPPETRPQPQLRGRHLSEETSRKLSPLRKISTPDQLPSMKDLEEAHFPTVFDRFKATEGASFGSPAAKRRLQTPEETSLSRSSSMGQISPSKLAARRCVSGRLGLGRTRTQGNFITNDERLPDVNLNISSSQSTPIENAEYSFPNRRSYQDWQYRNQTPTHWNIQLEGEKREE